MHRRFLWMVVAMGSATLLGCGDRELEGGSTTGGSGGAGPGAGGSGGATTGGAAGDGGQGGESPEELSIVSFASAVQPTNALRIDVQLETTQPAEVYVTFEPVDASIPQGEQTTRRTDVGTAHTVTLYGMREQTEYQAQIFAVSPDGQETSSEMFTVTTGTVPTSIGRGLDVVVDTSSYDGYVMTMPLAAGPNAVIYDREGEIVWYEPFDTEDTLAFHNVLPSGRIALYSREELVLLEATGEQVLALDRTGESRLFHHDVAELPGGELAVLTSSLGTGPNAGFIGDGIDVIDPMTKNVVWQWDFWDHFNTVDWQGLSGTFWDGYLVGAGFSHGNSMQLDEAGDYHISFHHMGLLTKIDGTTGDVIFTIGEQSDDFVVPPEMTFGFQHAFFPLGDDRYSFFNNGDGNTIPTSLGIEFEIDPQTGALEVVWEFDTGIFCTITSSVFHLSNGNRLVTCGPQARFWEVTETGEVVYEAVHEDAGLVYRFTPIEALNPFPTFTL